MSVSQQLFSTVTVFCDVMLVVGWQSNDVTERPAVFILIWLEDKGGRFLINYCTYLQNYTASLQR
jgi:hypothetical protein